MNHSFGVYTRPRGTHGKLDGFDSITYANGLPECTAPYQYTDPSQIQPYWAMAQQYVLAEHMFTTQGSDSFTAHQDLIRGGTIVEPGNAIVDFPTCWAEMLLGMRRPRAHAHFAHHRQNGTTTWARGPFRARTNSRRAITRFAISSTQKRFVEILLPPQNKVHGKLFNAFDVIYPVRNGPEWNTNIVIPQTQIFSDISGGTLPAVSWVIPDAPNSDHPGYSTDMGPHGSPAS